MKKSLLIFFSLIILFAASTDAAKPKRTSKNVRNQKQQTEQKIRETSAQIEAKNREITRALNDLNLLNAEIAECNIDIERLNAQIADINVQIAVVTDSIDALDRKLDELRTIMRTSLVEARKSRTSLNNLAFIVSAESFEQAFRRTQDLKQFAKWRSRKASEIADIKALLDQRRAHLDALRAQLTLAATQLAGQRKTLEGKQHATNELAAGLRKEKRQLERVIRDQQAKAAQLDKELEQVLLAEQREAEERARQEAERRKRENGGTQSGETAKTPGAAQSSPEDIKLTGDFASNKGRLPSPLDGKSTVVKPFGRQQHPDLPHVTTDNAGIDIQGEPGATVRAVFDGTVVGILLNSDAYHNTIILKHGNYITVYSGLGQFAVKKGDKISRGQAIGHLFIDPNENRSILHFEIRNASTPGQITKENPGQWLRK